MSRAGVRRLYRSAVEKFRVSVICTGNICRSPIGEVLLRDAVSREQDLAQRVEVASAGTAHWHVGERLDPRAAAALRRAGFPDDASLGAFANAEYLTHVDLCIAMTREHRHDLTSRRPDLPVVLVRELLGEGPLDVADPYFGTDDDFDACLATLQRAIPEMLAELRRRLRAPEASNSATSS